MKRLLLLTTILGFATTAIFAQDDMYFTPKKKSAAELKAEAERKAQLEAYRKAHTIDKTFYVGSDRNVDEYNRRHRRTVATTDSLGNDIITFTPGTGEYPDSIIIPTDSLYQMELSETTAKSRKKSREYYDDDDFYFSRRMNRFYGYAGPYWGPWHHYYDPFYYDWAWYGDPFYYGWHYGWSYAGWYDPWYYGSFYHPWGYWGHGPYWGHTIHIHGGSLAGNGNAPRSAWGTRNHSASRNGTASSRVSSMSRGVAAQDRSANRTVQATERIFGNRSTERSTGIYNRSNNSTYSAPTRSSSSSMSSSPGGYSGGGFSGRSGGGGGGSRGGGFGGRR